MHLLNAYIYINMYLCIVDLKNSHNLEVVSYVLLGGEF